MNVDQRAEQKILSVEVSGAPDTSRFTREASLHDVLAKNESSLTDVLKSCVPPRGHANCLAAHQAEVRMLAWEHHESLQRSSTDPLSSRPNTPRFSTRAPESRQQRSESMVRSVSASPESSGKVSQTSSFESSPKSEVFQSRSKQVSTSLNERPRSSHESDERSPFLRRRKLPISAAQKSYAARAAHHSVVFSTRTCARKGQVSYCPQ